MIENKNQLIRAAFPGSGSSGNEGYSVGAGDDSPGVRLAKDNLKLSDNRFVGLFMLLPDGTWEISDIRRTDFSKLILPNGLKINPIPFKPREITGIQDGAYYEFSWLLKEADEEHYHYVFTVNEAAGIEKVSPEGVIQKLHDSISKSSASDGQRTVRMIDTLKSQLTAGGKEIFIYELLQNANDYPQTENGKALPVDVEFHVTDSYLLFMHSGAEFNARNIAAICNINDKEKTENTGAIGYKGIGFKTVFIDNDYVYLRTGGYSFRFDRAYSKYRVDTPWQLQPIWTPRDDVDRQADRIFEEKKDKFRVQFAFRPTLHETLRDSDRNFVSLFEDVFINERVILFIPNIRSVRVFFHDRKRRDIVRTKDSSSWVVSTYAEDISEELRQFINNEIDEQEKSGTLKIPTKYYDFKRTSVSFACGRDGSRLKKVADSILYCYLPAKDASWGFDFLMNTDMIPNGPRNDIETDLGINREIAAIAGSKFFDWINDLCRSDENFNIADVFSLIPNFDDCMSMKGVGRRYRQLIERFKGEFKRRLLSEELIPTAAGCYACLKDIIIDDTFITLSGMLDEQQFIEFSGMKGVLPANVLGSDNNFRAFAKRYADQSQIFDKKSLRRMISDDGFQTWLRNQDNNDKFLSFLLNKGILPDFAEEEIFIEQESGELWPADELYYDVDDDLTDLSAFSDFIPYLSLGTRRKFKGNISWKKTVIPLFAKFDGQDFITETLLDEDNLEDTQEKLKDWDTSFHFFNYLARKKIVSDGIADLPFIDDEGKPHDDFSSCFIFFSSEEGHKLFSRPWLSSVSAYFVSNGYNQRTLMYFEENLGVRIFNDDIVIDEIILSPEYAENINSSQQESEDDSLDFVKFCFSHDHDDKEKDRFGSGSLKGYALSAADSEGQTDYFIPEDDEIFFPSEQYDKFSAKAWIDDGWMYCLSSFYLEESDTAEDELREFIHKAFGIKECTPENFYKDVVRPHISDIIDNTSGDDDGDGTKNIDFITYLDDNYELIFSKYNDSGRFRNIVLVAEGEYDIDPEEKHIYAYDEKLGSIISSDWFPDGMAWMCTQRYGKSKAILKIKAKEYDFRSFFDEVIRPGLKKINRGIDSIEKSIAFHNLVISHNKDLTPRQTEAMADARVYIYGHESPSEKSSGHRILSPMALELADKKLVEFSDLDVIDPAYKPEEHSDYWKSLGNEEFSLDDFISWLHENKSEFSQTISDRSRNIAFWQWAKENVPLDIADGLNDLPVLLTSGSMVAVSETVYLSDAYLKDGGIEAIVRQYQTDARFISPEYLGDGGEKRTIEEWAEFWTHVGVMSEILDILENTVIPNLANIENEELPATFARYRSKLEDRLGSLPEKLKDLRVKGRDGRFRPISEAVYVDCEKNEPFTFISLPAQISADDGDERRLIKEILECAGGTCIDILTGWQSAKIDRYLEVQDDEDEKELLESIHYRFISELDGMYKKDPTDLDEFWQLDQLKLFGKDGELHPASELTLGRVFVPLCDFETYFPNGRQYLSDSYLEQCGKGVSDMLHSVLHVHGDFEKGDIQSLAERDFAIYFWTKYLKKQGRVAHVRLWMEHEMFNAVTCIPTKDAVKKPSELYSVSIESYVKNVVKDWENKLPLGTLPDISYEDKESGEQKHLFDLLDFKKELDFTDALTALFAKVPSRRDVVSWMLNQYGENYSRLIDEYRANENAKWLNNKNKFVHISKLYALEKGNKTLWDYFHNLPRIINPDNLPYKLKKACDMLKIRTITNADLEVVPVGGKDASFSNKKILQLYSLVIAGLDGSGAEYADSEDEDQKKTGSKHGSKWKEIYNDYKNKISGMSLWQCQKISVRYKEDKEICQDLRRFYHETGSSKFYYVKSLYDRNVFQDFVNSFIEYLGTRTDKDIVRAIMNGREDAIDYVKENNNELMLDEDFKAELSKLGDLSEEEKACLKGNTADDDGAIEESARPTFNAEPQDDDQAEAEDGEPGQQDGNVNTSGMTEDGDSDTDGSAFSDDQVVHVREHTRSYPNGGSGGGHTSAGSSAGAATGHVRETLTGGSDSDGSAEEKSPDDSQDHTSSNSAPGSHSADRTDNSDENASGAESREEPAGRDDAGGQVEPEDETKDETEIPWPTGDDEAGQEEHEEERTESGAEEPEGSDDGLDEYGTPDEKIRDFDGAFAVNEHGTAPKTSSGRHGTGNGSRGSRGERSAPRRPKPFSKDDVENFGSKGQTRTLDVLEPTETEVEAINSILGEGLSPEQIADQNYLVQLRLYNFLNENNMAPEESRKDFVRNGSRRREQALHGGKYIHKCSAAGGIMYLSPAIWNKLASGRCIVLVYYGAKANSFMYFRTIDDILKWIREDDIVIKLTGEEKADAVSALYSGVLKGVKGTAYTLIRVKSNAKYNSLFAPLAQDPTEEHQENEGDYY